MTALINVVRGLLCGALLFALGVIRFRKVDGDDASEVTRHYLLAVWHEKIEGQPGRIGHFGNERQSQSKKTIKQPVLGDLYTPP